MAATEALCVMPAVLMLSKEEKQRRNYCGLIAVGQEEDNMDRLFLQWRYKRGNLHKVSLAMLASLHFNIKSRYMSLW